MVVQKAVENLKQKPHEDRQAVAGGIAILVVVILLVGWGFLFLRKIQKAPPTTLQGSVPTDQFDYSLLESVESDLSRFYEEAQKSRGAGNIEFNDTRSVEADLGGGQEPNAFGSESNL